VEILLANPKAGIITVPLNYRFVPQELAYVLTNCEAQTIILGDDFKSTFESTRPYLKGATNIITIGEPSPGMISYDELISSSPTDKPSVEVNEDDIVYIIYTGGTTAFPKGVMRTHKSMIAGAVANIIGHKLRHDDVCLLPVPPFHIALIYLLVTYIYSGCTTVLHKWNPQDFLRLVETERVTFVGLVPTMIRALVNLPELRKYDFSSLCRIPYSSAPMPEALLKLAMSIFGNKFDQVYAMTEFCPISLLPAETLELELARGKKDILLSCGKEYINIESRVVDEDGNDVAPGKIGELIVRGDGIMSGYWNSPEETAKSLKGGYLHTGDIARVDEDGYIYIVDRAKDMIITGGENIFCPEVENVLSHHPAVLEVAVIGIPDDKWGEAVKALIILRPEITATEQEIIEFCRPRMADYKRPKSVDFYKEFPRTPMGKVSKKDLKEKYWIGHARRIH
jgi:long-chain acyl-CoA synthetase